MKSTTKLLTSLMLASGLGMAISPAFAQQPDCGPMGQGGNFKERRAEHMQQRQTQLHDALKLSPEQEAGWKKYSESMQPREPKGGMPGNREDFSKLTAPERAEKMLELSKQHQERMGEHLAAMKAFYATLTPEQKKTFDSQHMGPRGGRRGPPQGDGAAGQPPAAK